MALVGRVRVRVCVCALLLALLAVAPVHGGQPLDEGGWPALRVEEGWYARDDPPEPVPPIESEEQVAELLQRYDLRSITAQCYASGPRCDHRSCHKIGRALVRVDPGVLPLEATSDTCGDAVLHGFIEDLFALYADTIPLYLAHDYAHYVCFQLGDEVAGTCLHAIGHTLFRTFGQDQGLDVCGRLPTWPTRHACATGVWMLRSERLAAAPPERYVSCATKATLACFTYAFGGSLGSADSVPRITANCYQAFAEPAATRALYENMEYAAHHAVARTADNVRTSESRSMPKSVGEEDGGKGASVRSPPVDRSRLLAPCVYGAQLSTLEVTERAELCQLLPVREHRLACLDGWRRRMLAVTVEGREGACYEVYGLDVPAMPRPVPLSDEERQEMLERCLELASMRSHDIRADWSLYSDLP